ncbi:FHA domain-containing protein [bacterium]|nr:FHA domain-containing protein [bacterium]
MKVHEFGLRPERQRLFSHQGEGYSFPVDGTPFRLGRRPDSPQQQAEARWEDGQLFVRDLGGQDTYINGQPVKSGEWTVLPPQARLALGDSHQDSLVLGVGAPAGLDSASQPTRYRLRLSDGRTQELQASMKVGRRTGNDLTLSHPSVSREHAFLQAGRGSLKVYDNASTQGTYVNGERLEAKKWVEVPLGAELRFGQEPVSFEAEKPLLVSFYGDGSTPDIAEYVKAQPSRLEPALERAGAPVMVRGAVAQGSIVKAAAYTALPALTATAMVAAGVVAGVALTGPAGPVLALVEGAVALGAGTITYQLRHLFKGGMGALKERAKGVAEWMRPWAHVQTKVINQGPRLEQFQDLWKTSLSSFPSARHVVYVSGHGTQKSAAGLNFADLGQSVRGAEMMVLDACNGAQLESLSKLTESAQVAIASEHKVNGAGFPIQQMFGQSEFARDPRKLAADMVQASSHYRRADSLVAVDLAQLKHQLLPGLNALGPALLELPGLRKQMKSALKESQRSDTGFLQQKVDLGNFLARLNRIPGLSQACPELKAVSESFDRTVLAMMGQGTLTFDRRPDSQLPEGWVKFLKAI